MTKETFHKIMSGLVEARAHVNGKATGARVHSPAPAKVDVKELRSTLGLSQAEFAEGFAMKVATLRNWEQGRRSPEGPALVLLTLIKRDPERVIKTIWPRRQAG